MPRRGVERALDQAEILRVFDLTALRDQLQRNPRAPGAARLKAVLDSHTAGDTLTWSELEELFLALVDRAGLPRPEVNEFVDLHDGGPPIRPDFSWPAHHTGCRDQWGHAPRRLGVRPRPRPAPRPGGWHVIRLTKRQLTRDPQRVAWLLGAHLGG